MIESGSPEQWSIDRDMALMQERIDQLTEQLARERAAHAAALAEVAELNKGLSGDLRKLADAQATIAAARSAATRDALWSPTERLSAVITVLNRPLEG